MSGCRSDGPASPSNRFSVAERLSEPDSDASLVSRKDCGKALVLVAVEEGVDVIVGRLVRVGGRLYVILRDGRIIPLDQLKPSQQAQDKLPEPNYDAFYRWCTRTATERTCREYVNYLRRFPWPLTRERLYELRLTKWHVLALRAYLNFLEERGVDVGSWRELRALKIPSTGEDRYIPSAESLRDALPRLLPRYRLVYYVMLYTALRLEHVLRLLREWPALRGEGRAHRWLLRAYSSTILLGPWH